LYYDGSADYSSILINTETPSGHDGLPLAGPLYSFSSLKVKKGEQLPSGYKVSTSQPRDHGFEPYSGHDHVSSYDTSTGLFQEADSKVINISCKNFTQSCLNKYV
jgi:hypothetical protein